MNNMNANMNNAFIRANKKFIYSYSRTANMIMLYIRIPLFLSEPYLQSIPTDSPGFEQYSNLLIRGLHHALVS